MKHKTKSIISLFMALCLMLSLGVGALANEEYPVGGDGTDPKDTGSYTTPGPDTEESTQETVPELTGHTVTVAVNDSNMGSATVSVGGQEAGTTLSNVAEGTVVTVNCTAADGYELAEIWYREANTETYTVQAVNKTFEMPGYDVEVRVGFKTETINPTSSPLRVFVDDEIVGGTVTADPISVGNEDSKTITLTAYPEPGYKLGKFTVTEYSSAHTIDVTMDGTDPNKGTFTIGPVWVEVTATFERVPYDVPARTDFDNGYILAGAESASVGDTVTLYAYPAEGYELTECYITYDDGVTTFAMTRATQRTDVAFTDNVGTFRMPAGNVTVHATFSEIQSEPETHQILTSAPHADLYIEGGADRKADETIRFTVTPDRGYYVTRVWAGTTLLTPSSGWYSFQMPDNDITITVECAWWWGDWHYIHTSYNSAYGSVSVESWAYTNETVYFTVTPDSGYYYDDYDIWAYTSGGSWVPVTHYSGNTWYFTMPDDDVTIYADFDGYGKYSISKEVEGDGSISVRSSANAGDTVYIYPYPSSGQSLTSLKVYYNGGSWWYESVHGSYGKWLEVDVDYSTSRGAYYFKMPAYDVVVYAAFTDGQTVTVSDPKNGDVKVSSKYAEKGDLVYITIDPDNGYELDTLEVTNSLGRSVDVTELSENYYVFRMPGTSVKVSATFRSTTYMNFYDVSSGSWYYNAVKYVYEKGIMQGTSTYYFSPDADLSRGMLATILYRMAGSPAVSDYSSFSDVSTTAYYARAIAWAEAQGIVRGVSSTSFAPDSSVTREQLVTILSRYAQYRGYDTNVVTDYLSGFGDASRASEYARPALNWAVGRHIIAGQGGGVLAPTATASRAEVAQVLMNYMAVFA